MAKPLVAIVGRPNVGKSTLFNRLIRKKLAIADDKPGVTRDRLYSDVEWNGVPFTLIDTGGLMNAEDESIDALVSAAAEAAMAEADKVVFVADGKLGLTDIDIQIARKVQRVKVPVLLAVTKIDTMDQMSEAYEYYSLGLGDPIPVSGISGMNSGDLMDRIVEGFEPEPEDADAGDKIRLAVLGRPNVGKSSLVNRILGTEKQIVSDVPGTTRDATDHPIKYMNRDIVLVDTAGLMRKAKLGRKEAIDYYTSIRTVRALESCDVAAVLIDTEEGLTQYERRLLDDVRAKGKGLIVVYNKWDLIEKDTNTMKATEDEFHLQLPDLSFAPMTFISAMTGQRSRKVLDLAIKVYDERLKRISTSKFNQFIEMVTGMTPPPAIKGRWLKIKYGSQVSVAPPLFALHLNDPHLMPDSYKKFLERRIREEFGFVGVPIRVVFRKK